MKEEAYVPDPLNSQASVLVDAQTDIKTAIKQAVLSGLGGEAVKVQVKKIIDRAIARIRSPTLKEDGRRSLMKFADTTYTNFTGSLPKIRAELLPAVIVLMRAITAKEEQGDKYYPHTKEERIASAKLGYTAHNMGIPLQEFQKIYIDRVTKALNGLAEQRALDPNDFRGKNSLRNLAEMQVRYERHQSEIADLKQRGIRLVVCSVHADCSDRCAEYQGRVYSLDGSRGVTEDGFEYVPLEEATNNPKNLYGPTQAGRYYQNGLLGFNCRHKLFEYKAGMVIPSVSEQTQKREYAITRTQRELERAVIDAREKALEQKGVNIAEYRKWKAEAERRYRLYRAYSKEMGRAYYPDRVKIL